MSIPINTDNSVQLTYSSFPFTITNVDNYASSNFVLSLSTNNSNYTKNASNALKANIDTKQNTLTSSTNLLGIGTAITAIDYNKISVNKPTNFQADWLTTIINKPNVFPADMTVIYNKTETNNLITNSSNYTLNASNALRSSINNIYTKTETNNLISNSSNYTLNASNALQTNINNTNSNFANYLPKSGGTISGLLTTGNITISGQIGRLNIVDDFHYIEFSQATDTTTIMEYGKVVFLIGQTRTERAKINASGLTATAFFGNGAGITSLDYNNILTNKPSTFPADMTNIYTKTETNNLLNAKENTLTASTSLLGNGSAITNLTYANITGKPTNFQADWLTTIINKPSTFTADMTNIYTKIETDGRYLKLDGTNNINELLNINAADNTTGGTKGIIFRSGYNAIGNNYNCSILTYDHDANGFCDGLSINGWDGISFCTGANTRNERMRIDKDGNVNIGTTGQSYKLYVNGTSYLNGNSTINGSLSATTINRNGVEIDSRYLKLSGGTITGSLRVSDQFQVGDASYQLLLGQPTASTAATIQTIQQDVGYNQKLTLQAAGGNVGIGTTNPSNILQVGDGGKFRISNGISDYTLIGTKDTDGLTNTRIVISGNTRSGGGNIDYVATSSTGAHKFYTTDILTERMRILNNGNVGIGTNNPSCKLSLGSSSGYKVLSLWDNGLDNNFQFNGFGANGGLCFNIYNNTTDSFQFRAAASATAANEVMRINGNGSVCIGTASATSTNTKLTISGASYGYSQPLVNIIQTWGWDGNYALQVSGYTNLGGIRINGGDLGNSIYKTDAGTMGFSTTNGAIYIFVNGVEKAKFDTNGTTNISGVLTVPNITLGGTSGKINVVDDYHYIQFNQSTDTTTIQEYGTISFNIGAAKAQMAYINLGGMGVNGSLNVSGLTRHTQLFNYGETVSYQTGFNATPSANGWFWMSNSFWSGYGTPSYLTIAIKANGNGAVWYGRAFLNGGGGFWDVICDFRTPNGASNTISVQDFWGSNGANALMISIQNPVYAGTFNIKISG